MSYSWIIVALLLFFVTCCVESDFNSFHRDHQSALRLSRHMRLRRNVYESQRDLLFAQEFFSTSMGGSLDILTRTQPRTLLIHTRIENQNDAILLVRDNLVMNTVTFQPLTFYNLAAITHLPVTVASILLPNIMESNATSNSTLDKDTKLRLQEFSRVLQNVSLLINTEAVFVDSSQISRGNQIINNVSQLVDDSLTSGSVTADKLNQLVQLLDPQLRDNVRDAVLDYLVCLNNSIEELGIGGSYGNVSVVIALHPFAYPNSFLVQYYEQLLNVTINDRMDPNRIIFQPTVFESESCPTNYKEEFNPAAEPSVCAFSNASLQSHLSEIFNGGNATTSVHTLLSQAASDLICSENFTLPTCQSNRQNEDQISRVHGFQTRVERGFIILIIFFASVAIVFGTTVLCIFYEDRLMKRESMTVRLEKLHSKYKGATVFTPVNGIQSSVSVRNPGFSLTDSQVHCRELIHYSESINE